MRFVPRGRRPTWPAIFLRRAASAASSRAAGCCSAAAEESLRSHRGRAYGVESVRTEKNSIKGGETNQSPQSDRTRRGRDGPSFPITLSFCTLVSFGGRVWFGVGFRVGKAKELASSFRTFNAPCRPPSRPVRHPSLPVGAAAAEGAVPPRCNAHQTMAEDAGEGSGSSEVVRWCLRGVCSCTAGSR